MRRMIAPLALIFAAFLVGGCGDTTQSDNRPHPLGPSWVEADGHHTRAKPEVIPEGEGCATCHEPRSPREPLNCWACHKEELWNQWPEQPEQLSRQEQIFYCHNCHFENAHEEFEEQGVWVNFPSEEEPDPENLHGDYAEALFLKCAGCHGDVGDGGRAGVNCFDCHFGSPTSFEEHKEPQDGAAHKIPENPWFEVCLDCHAGVRKFEAQLGQDPPNWSFCANCHHPTPETPEEAGSVVAWVRDTGHPTAAGDLERCALCHQPDNWNQFVQEPDPQGHCHFCHLEDPHDDWPGNWMTDHPPYAEGNFIHCAGCHGIEGEHELPAEVTSPITGEALSVVSCFNCHFGADFTFANHTEGEGAAPHKIPAQPTFGICADCHDAVRRFEPQLGLTPPEWSFCQGCHHPTPDTPGGAEAVLSWVRDSGHPEASLQVECSVCHQPDNWNQFVLEPDPEGHCHFCHTEDPHDTWPGNWVTDHPPYAEGNFIHCAGCHGTAGDHELTASVTSPITNQELTVVSCFNCHFGADFTFENHKQPEGGAPHKVPFAASFTICIDCHDAVRRFQPLLGYNPPERSFCEACHGPIA